MLLCEQEIKRLVKSMKKIRKVADNNGIYPISDEIGEILDWLNVLDFEGVLKCKKKN